jgi:hypothetical protein
MTSSILLSKHLEHKFKTTTIGRNFNVLEASSEKCTFEECPTFLLHQMFN